MVVSIGFCGRGFLEFTQEFTQSSPKKSGIVSPRNGSVVDIISMVDSFAQHHKYRLTTTIKAHMHAKCAAMLLSCIVFLHGFVLKYGTPQSTG